MRPPADFIELCCSWLCFVPAYCIFVGLQVHVKPYSGAVRMEGQAWAIDEEVQPKPHFWGHHRGHQPELAPAPQLHGRRRVRVAQGMRNLCGLFCPAWCCPAFTLVLLHYNTAPEPAYDTRAASRVGCGMQVTSTINGILKGPSKVYLSHRGELLVRGLTASMAVHIRFPSSGKRLARGVVRTSAASISLSLAAIHMGLAHSSACAQEGFIVADGRRLDSPRLHGAWDDKLVAEASDGAQQVLWQKAAAPANPSRYAARVPCRTKMLCPTCARMRAVGRPSAQVAGAHQLLLPPQRDDRGAQSAPASHGLPLALRRARHGRGPLLTGFPCALFRCLCLHGFLCLPAYG